MDDITLILNAAADGDRQSADALLPLVYDELRNLAHVRMEREMSAHTLQPTALVHEAWLRLVQDDRRDWKSRSYFFAAAATAMRRILVEHARRKAQLKRGGDLQRVALDDLDLAELPQDDVVLMLDEALHALELEHPKWAQVVVMRYFGGMSQDEVADALQISKPTVARYWAAAKVWMIDAIESRN
ncbi:MAG: sigma-70 family RNA polymerase sigma factor [Pontiellaceae bacterium]|nr:sigma-70 family RNA polymerase sigma factor [Pontiellaceae bacterium]MBN2785864.1 sigma-70 family RNA polymerase sigma factor [Pontiellaceae bacterium]